jgi:hypothetical protein
MTPCKTCVCGVAGNTVVRQIIVEGSTPSTRFCGYSPTARDTALKKQVMGVQISLSACWRYRISDSMLDCQFSGQGSTPCSAVKVRKIALWERNRLENDATVTGDGSNPLSSVVDCWLSGRRQPIANRSIRI